MRIANPMPLEIERKFLVISEAWKAHSGSLIRQGYLNCDPRSIVRIRVSGDSAWICIKTPSTGVTRAEFEYPIPRGDADVLLALCEAPLVEKIRYRLQFAGRLWEIDEFQGANAGLVIAEVELERAEDPVALPAWIGAEITEDPRYFNSNLAAHPYHQWKE